MKLSKPMLRKQYNQSILSCDFFTNEGKNTLWFSFEHIQSKYISTEVSDGLLIALLPLAMQLNEDIYVDHTVSTKLLYQINEYLIPALHMAYPEVWHKVSVRAKKTTSKVHNKKGINATGLSCGVDSFATIVQHLNSDASHHIDAFTFFNVGSHGSYGGEDARNIFKQRIDLVSPYANEVHKPLIIIDSNINELLNIHHQKTHTLRGAACILLLQKYIRNYYYAATLRFDFFQLNDFDMGYYDTLILPMVSTESTTFYSSVSPYTRVERTKIISDYEPTYRHLNVCVAHNKTQSTYNCSKCKKCLRTLLTLELLGKLENYASVFDIDTYRQHREKFIRKVITEKSDNHYFEDIYTLMLEVNFDTQPYISEILTSEDS